MGISTLAFETETHAAGRLERRNAKAILDFFSLRWLAVNSGLKRFFSLLGVAQRKNLVGVQQAQRIEYGFNLLH